MTSVRKVAFCPHCGNRAPQRLIHTQHFLSYGYSLDGDRSDYDLPSIYFVVECETCHEILLYLAEGYEPEGNAFHQTDLIWPDPGSLHRSVPRRVREHYEEAARIKNLAPNAFAVQIRRALEAVCEDRGTKKGTLQRKLEELSTRGEIPPVLAQMTDILRLLGNIGAHADEQSVKPGHVSAIDKFFRAIVEYVYVSPSIIRAIRSQLEMLKAAETEEIAG